MQAKILLRQSLLARRRAMSAGEVEDRSARLVSRLLEQVTHGQRVFCYVSQGHEVQTHTVIARWLERSISVALPWMDAGGAMHAVPIRSWGELSVGPHGILQPPAPAPGLAWECADLCVLPCVAVTADGRRLGRGGGHYDRWLAAHHVGRTVALAYGWQVVDALPIESWDQSVDAVITEKATLGSTPTG